MRNLQCKTIVIIVLFLEVILITGGCSKKDDAEIYEKYGNTNWTNDDTTTSTKFYVSVGDEGTILTSSDGTTWTSRTSGTTNILNGVAYGNNTIVTVGNSGIILTSSDNGSTWDNMSPGTGNHLFGVIYGNSKFVMMGKGGKSSLRTKEPHGLQRLLQQHTILWELPTQTVNLWQWDITGTSSLHQMETLGIIEPLEH